MTTKRSAALLAACLALGLAGCTNDDGGPAATPTATPSPTPALTSTSTPPPTPSTSPTRTASATPPASVTPPPSATPSLSATLTATASPTATTNPLRLLALHAEPDPTAGGRVVDAEGREVLLRGVNVNALVEYWQYGAFPTVFPLTEADADLMAAIGWNTVRLLLSWSRVEPEPGLYDEAYLDEAAGAVRLFAARAIYSVIDLHQDAWGATLAAGPEQVCVPPAEPGLGWDGAPGWATFDGGQPRCASLGIRELNPAVSAAFQAFFDDVPGPGGVGIRTRYVRMLAHVAARFAREPAVAGYDLMNEPNAFSSEQNQALSDLYAEGLAAIRDAEREAGGFAHLVFFEPSALWSTFGSGAPPDFARDRDLVYAPHLYTGGFTGGPITREAFEVARAEAQQFGGAPVLSGEWGADPRRVGGDTYFLDHQALQDAFRFGATLWTWRESCGDPHKAGDSRAGRVPYVWGEFEVDCATNAALGRREALIEALTRAYVRAAPGRLVESRYDVTTAALVARGTAAEPGTELLAFCPVFSDVTVDSSGLADVQRLPAPGGNSYLVARAGGGDWSLTVRPRVGE